MLASLVWGPWVITTRACMHNLSCLTHDTGPNTMTDALHCSQLVPPLTLNVSFTVVLDWSSSQVLSSRVS